MRKLAIAVLTAGVFAAPLGAQSQYNFRVAQAMSPTGKYVLPICPLKGGDFHTSTAGLALKVSAEGVTDYSGGKSTIDSKKYHDQLDRAMKSATDALASNQNNGAGWYYLARADLQLGDLRGADTAFTRLEKISPDCAEEIKSWRQKAWVVLVQPSTGFMAAKQNDSAIAVLRDAMIIARYYPQAMYNLGATYGQMGQYDSALVYFKMAEANAGAQSSVADLANIQKLATYNTAFLYGQKQDLPDAIVWYKKYLVLDPNDADVKRALSSTLRASGNDAEANSYENALMSSGSLSGGELSGVGVREFNNKNYQGAADAFNKVLATDSLNHDALFNLANTYYAMGDAKNLIATAQRLIAIDPLGDKNIRLLANGYRLAADTAKQIDVTVKLLGMTDFITLDHFAITKDGAKLGGFATGNDAETAAGKTIPPAPMTVVFEFTNAAGAVVGSQEVSIPALAANVKAEINVSVPATGVVGWKYHVK